MKNETVNLLNTLNTIDNTKELHDFLDNIHDKSITFITYFNDICNKKNLKKSDLIYKANINRTYGYQILNGDKKPSRDKILQLCIGANLTLKETNKCLILGNVNELYVKNPRDSIIIFSINKNLSIIDIDELLYEYNLPLLGEKEL